jgi:hypothetical protein
VVVVEALSVDIEGGSFQHNTHHDGEQVTTQIRLMAEASGAFIISILST